MAEQPASTGDHTPDSTENRTGTHIAPDQAGITNRPAEESTRQEKVVESSPTA